MPVNNNLKPKNFPMEIKFGHEPKTEIHNNLENIKVSLISSPSMYELHSYCIPFANGTWAEDPLSIYENARQDKNISDLIIHHVFNRKILPTTLETIRVNFLLEGISLQEVTHILRQRKAVFSAECSGDKFLHDKDFVIPTAIENSPEYADRYKEICRMSKQLYCDMVDSKVINIHDARYILPRSMETFYFMSMSLGDCMQFIYDRVDKQIQPQSDNVLAYGMITELVKQWPILVKTLNSAYIHRKSDFYIKTARQFRSSNFYAPDADSDVFEWNQDDFIYKGKRRDEMLGTGDTDLGLDPDKDVFTEILKNTCDFLDEIEEQVDDIYGHGFFDQDIPESLMNTLR